MSLKGIFTSDTARLVYALVYLDGERRQRELKITPYLYHNVAAADHWYVSIHSQIELEGFYLEDAAAALSELKDIYRNMVKLNIILLESKKNGQDKLA